MTVSSAGLEDAHEVVQFLEREGYHPIVLGGLAILFAGYGATKDVDVLVREAEYGGVEFLKGEGIKIFANTGRFTNGQLELANGRTVAFDVMNPSLFVGHGHRGEDFFSFVAQEASAASRNGRYALPSVVFYTRLLVPGQHGEAYIERIIRDLDEGVPERFLDEAMQIARRFGTVTGVRRKIARLKTIRTGRT
jgi:hypothetical protein